MNSNKRSSSKTLDTQHNQKLKEFNDRVSSLNTQKNKLDSIESQLSTLSNMTLSNLSDEEFNEYMQLIDKKKETQKLIDNTQHGIDELHYYMETADVIFKYYDILKNGNDNDTSMTNITENSILKFFTKTENTTPRVPSSESLPQEKDRASLLDKYMEHVDPNYMKLSSTGSAYQNADSCPFCDSKNRTILINDGLMYCNECHTIETIIIDHEKPSYKDPPKEISYFSYKRLNHLNEWISQVQGKESTDIPPEVYDRILLEINKQRITNMAEITPTKIKQILKSLKLNRYYEHTPHIINRLNGAPTPNFTPEVEEKLRQMFKMIQIPFFNHSPKTRKNFLSYSYTIRKCLQLLELDEYLEFFPLLKSREKTFAMDQIWKKICQDLKWSFIPSI